MLLLCCLVELVLWRGVFCVLLVLGVVFGLQCWID